MFKKNCWASGAQENKYCITKTWKNRVLDCFPQPISLFRTTLFLNYSIIHEQHKGLGHVIKRRKNVHVSKEGEGRYCYDSINTLVREHAFKA